MKDSRIVYKSFDEIKNSLDMHVNNKFIFREDQVRAYSGTTFNQTNWSSKNMRRIYFSDCKFTEINFKSTGFTNSIFNNCEFCGGILDFTIFDECIFINCNFYDYHLNATSFCKSEFLDCSMNNLTLEACFFTDTLFNGFEFTKCKITDIIWENAKFLQCNFNTTLLQKLNFEFTYFDKIHFYNTALPFASLPFTFGGLEYIKNTPDNVYITTMHPSFENNLMSKKQYLELLPDLLLFYKDTLNYFPLANINLVVGNTTEGIDAIEKGLEFWFRLQNYKIMFYLCELANVHNFSIETRKKIYKIIEKCNNWIQVHENWDKQKRWSIQQYKMRECLLNSKSMPHVTLEFNTSIKCSDYNTLASFMQTFDTLLLPKNSYYSLELRHNSPFQIFYEIFATEPILFNTIVGIITIIGIVDQIYTNHFKDKVDKAKIEKSFSREELSQIEQNITKNIINVNYNFYNCNINNIDTDYFNRQNIGCENPKSSGSSQ